MTNSRIKIEPYNGRTCRSVTYRIDGLVAVHLTQRLTTKQGDTSALSPKISWVSATQPRDLSYAKAFAECLTLAVTVSEGWAAESAASQSILFCQPVASPDQVGRDALLF